MLGKTYTANISFIGLKALNKTGNGYFRFSGAIVKSISQLNKPDTRYDEYIIYLYSLP